ncbi:carboxyl-terminal-processing peptidase 1, chloroplastic [Gastrolobium bilobum]|uniref:carboxyl-terminal-processing peptidase 1, chloroplastic n=1 Tax=Gastrolobium bilobum TaxID=150636 RepID=UPI002AB1D031|nr:carboxyl-terminal-processing peptidase 1, chloroplastic [Gastrolobium bilobum]XP_061362569.1 carboxyl-terminal-processing peptidase 1, chloroplastic [Gastrolobium bilobum]
MNGCVWLKLTPPSTTVTQSRPQLFHIPSNPRLLCSNWVHHTVLGALSGALSFGFLFSLPSAFALQPPSLPTLYSETCRDVQPQQDMLQTGPEVVTNEGLVEEAWQIVNDTFLDTGRHRWSQDTWQLKREDILSNSIQTRSKAHHIIKRMLASLSDPYTRFLSPEEFSKMARYDMTGIGINLREVPDENGDIRMKVLGIILDSPAHSAGVRQGDEVLTVNNMEVKGKSAFEVSSMLQGPNGTSVTIQVKHGNCGPAESIEVQRQLVARTPVFYRLEQTDSGATRVGYIRLKEFNALARKDLVVAMKRLQDMGASSFVLDLRDNLGGLVQAGIEIAKLFLSEGDTIIYTVGRDPLFQTAIVTDTSPLVQAPVVVLVNDKTASASEIVASALHDNCRAVLVGKRTFGKGLIQSVFELHDGSGVVITVGKYVTPNHKDINGNGIEPDFQKLPAWDDVSQHLSKCSMLRQG